MTTYVNVHPKKLRAKADCEPGYSLLRVFTEDAELSLFFHKDGEFPHNISDEVLVEVTRLLNGGEVRPEVEVAPLEKDAFWGYLDAELLRQGQGVAELSEVARLYERFDNPKLAACELIRQRSDRAA